MGDAKASINIIMADATGATAVRSYSDLCIIGDDGHKVETGTPRGIDAQPDDAKMVLATVNIDGISQFDGLTNGPKNLTYTHIGTTMEWDGGASRDVHGNGEFMLYDSDANNFIIITVTDASQMDGDRTDVITIQDGVIADAITVIQLDDELLTDAPVITDASGNACVVDTATNYPRPADPQDYTINPDDKSLIAIQNSTVVGTLTDISIDYSIYKIARAYTSLTGVDADHKSGTEISKAAAKMFANGAGTVSVMNCYDGDSKEYALCLTELETQKYAYDIMVPVVDVDDADFVLCAAHAIAYNKIIIAPKIGTATVVRTSWGNLTRDEGQVGICYDTTTYSIGELSGAAAAIIAQKKPWIPATWGKVSGINASGYSRDDIITLEGASDTLGGSTFIQVGTSIVLSSARGLAAGTWTDVARTKQYLRNGAEDEWVSAKLRIANSNQKIPYTAAGLIQVKNILSTPLTKAQRDGALRETSYTADGTKLPGFIISVPNIEDIPAAYKTARQLPEIEITAYLSGAIETLNPVCFTISLGEA